jgi:beta-N-acetylhexosaminidase
VDAQRGIARRMVIGLPPDGLSPPWEKDFAAYPPAGVILFRRDFTDLESLRSLTRRLRDLARPRRIFVAMDEEGGFVSQLAGHWIVPPNATLLARGALPGEVEWAARVTGERLRAVGVDWVYAPVADVDSRPENPVIGPRAFGTESAEVAERVAETLAGFRAAGVASCLKHFPGHGDTTLDSHLDLPRCDASLEVLETRELVPFRENLDAPAMMTAHVVFPAIDPDAPATFSRPVVQGLLRERMAFPGITVTDALEMKGAATGRSATDVGRLALEAGCDLLLYAFHDEAVRRARLELGRLLVEGTLDHASFDAARPRLATFDQAHREPTAEELARPLKSLTPPGWEERMAGIVERGLRLEGALPAAAGGGRWRVSEPAFPYGPPLAEELRALGTVLGAEDPALEVIVVMSRKRLPEEEVERLRGIARSRPTALVGLQSDAFLGRIPEAALRISAADATPLTRRVVARALATAARVPSAGG